MRTLNGKRTKLNAIVHFVSIIQRFRTIDDKSNTNWPFASNTFEENEQPNPKCRVKINREKLSESYRFLGRELQSKYIP